MNMPEETKQTQIKVSVIMGVYNQWDRDALNLAVDSILKQTLHELEFIIYDDGSSPGAGAYIYELMKKDKRIRVYGTRENHGLAFSLNACVGLTQGRYIARMDADDVSAPERLSRQYNFLETHPDYAWCGTNARLFDAKSIWGCRRMPEEPKESDYLKYSPYIHPSVMYRQEILRENPYVVSHETLRCEDYEIFMRLRQQGYYGYNIQEPLFYYREDQAAYRKRTMHFRWNETKIRYRNFKTMHLLFPIGWFYVLRPMLACLIPGRCIAWLKRKESGYGRRGMAAGEPPSILSEAAEKKPEILSGMEGVLQTGTGPMAG